MLSKLVKRRKRKCQNCNGTGTVSGKAVVIGGAPKQVECPSCGGTGRTSGKHVDHIDQLYDMIRVKDMTRRAFRKAYLRATDQKLATRDLNRMVTTMKIQRLNRSRIDENLRHGRI